MRCLVTGAQGFIGRYLCDALLARGAAVEVLGIGRSPRVRARAGRPSPAAALEDRCAYEQVDLLDAARLREVVSRFRPELVFHLAAGLRRDGEAGIVRTNVMGTLALMDAIGDALVDREIRTRVVLASSGGVYGVLPPERIPVSESAGCDPADVYGASKLAAEEVARVLARRQGIEVVTARIFNVCGPGQDEHHVCGRLAAQLRAPATELRIGRMDTTRDFMDVRDVAAALAWLARHGEPGGCYNVATGRETSIADVVQRMIGLAGWAGSVHVEETPLRATDVPRHAGDASRLHALGFVPGYTLDDSLRDMLAYQRAGDGRAAC